MNERELLLESASITKQRNPELTRALIIRIDKVDFPVPPFIELIAIVFIENSLIKYLYYRGSQAVLP
jgi:hypothetical protein